MHGKKKRISAVYSNFGKNTVEQQWLVWLLLLQKTAVFSDLLFRFFDRFTEKTNQFI